MSYLLLSCRFSHYTGVLLTSGFLLFGTGLSVNAQAAESIQETGQKVTAQVTIDGKEQGVKKQKAIAQQTVVSGLVDTQAFQSQHPQPTEAHLEDLEMTKASASTTSSPSPEVSLPVLSPPPVPSPPPATPSQRQPLPATDLTEESAYTLGSGDVVNINIFRVPQYSSESQVLIDGTLNLPLVGKVTVDGLTLAAASEAISARYAQYLRRPLITLSLLSRRPLQISIAGEINRPGSYTIDQGNNQNSRLSRLIGTSGGVTQSADLAQVRVQRARAGSGPQAIVLNLVDLIANGNLAQDITLRDGDEVFIPTASVPTENAALLADSNLAADSNQPINVAVVGEVYRPGPYTLRGSVARTGDAGTPGSSGSANSPTTVTTAIQVAGGIKPEADIRKVQVVRPTRTGVPQIFEADLWSLLTDGDLAQDAALQEGDTIIVPVATALTAQEISEIASASFSPNTIRVNVVGEVKRPGTVELPPNTPLSQAILAVGGFNQSRASQGTADLVRLNENGTVTRSEIPVDFAQGISEENNPLLRNNDVVIVDRNALAGFSDTLGTVLNPLRGVFSLFRLFDFFD
ncbi:MAG: SLBB domain-containing protein [Cyanobacteria bacterium J06621_3]